MFKISAEADFFYMLQIFYLNKNYKWNEIDFEALEIILRIIFITLSQIYLINQTEVKERYIQRSRKKNYLWFYK